MNSRKLINIGSNSQQIYYCRYITRTSRAVSSADGTAFRTDAHVTPKGQCSHISVVVTRWLRLVLQRRCDKKMLVAKTIGDCVNRYYVNAS